MTVLRLQLELLPTNSDGRRGPVHDGYRGAISFGETTDAGVPIVHETVLVFEGVDRLCPGESASARAWVVASEHLPDDVGPGTTLEYVEGYRTVARARVLEVRSDATPYPVRDTQDAKSRPLDPA